MKKRILVLLTTVVLALSFLTVGVCADIEIQMDATTETEEISADEAEETEETAGTEEISFVSVSEDVVGENNNRSSTPSDTPKKSPTPSPAPILSGDCSALFDSHVEWKVIKISDEGKMKLVISGSGAIADYEKGDSLVQRIHTKLHKLSSYQKASIVEVEIREGVTAIGFEVFANASDVKKITLPNSLCSICR